MLAVVLSEEKFWGTFLLPFHFVDFSGGKHNVDMGLTLAVGHGANLVVDGIGVVEILQMAVYKLLHDFLVFFKA